MHPLVVHRPALAPQQSVDHPPSPADLLSSNVPEAMPELGLLNADGLAPMALGAAVLAHHPAGESLRAQKFPSSNSYCFAEAFG